MSPLRSRQIGALVLVASLSACSDSKSSVAPRSLDPSSTSPAFTLSSGSTSKLLGRATFSDPHDQNFDVKRVTGDWHMQIKAKPAFDIAIQTIDFPVGSQSGWHMHPGPVFIQVVSGTMTFYMSDDPTCTPMVVTAGHGYLDMGDHAHIARNESDAASQNVVTYFAPPGVPLRIDAPNPGNCPF
jgi:hypothetical protein